MTKDLVKNEQFHGIPVRVIMHEEQAVIPLNDIADGIGIDRSSLHKLLKRNEDILGEFVSMVIMTSEAGPRETICLTRDGVTGILMKMDYNRSKLPKIKENIIGFQKWAIETLSKIISGETTAIPTVDLDILIKQHLSIADSLVQFAHIDRGIATSVAIAKVEFETGNDLSCYKSLLRKNTDQPPGLLNATMIGEKLGGLSPHQINDVLGSLGLAYLIGKKWQPSPNGQQYGEYVPFTVLHPNGTAHSDYQWRWATKIVPLVKEYLTKVEKQKQLQLEK
jgi:prophage antirepressor-like protein